MAGAYVYQEYPKSVYRNGAERVVGNAEDDFAAVKEGFSDWGEDQALMISGRTPKTGGKPDSKQRPRAQAENFDLEAE